MIRSIAIGLIMLVSAPNVYSDWDVKNVRVLKVLQYQRGATSIARVVYEVDGDSIFAPGFTCAPTTQPVDGSSTYQAAYWSATTDNLQQVMVGQLLAAQAQGLSVDLYFDTAYQGACNVEPAWGYGGLGVKLMGVAVNPQ